MALSPTTLQLSNSMAESASISERISTWLSNPRNVERVSESCILSTTRNAIVGFGFGGLFGLFMSGIPAGETSTAALDSLPFKSQFRSVLRDMRIKTWSSAKNFGLVSLLFSGFECAIEKYRARTDIYNTMSAGCLSGAVLAKGTGAKGMLVGCAGFAAFSSAMEHFLAGESD